jgi:predicted DNA-binding helix-hairpin-helix protein
VNTISKLQLLGSSSKWDTCGPGMDKQSLPGVYQAKTPHGTCSLMKVLYTNQCKHDCKYCINSTSCKKKPVIFNPQELSSAFMSYVKKGVVEGLFLSSAVPGDPDKITNKIIETVELIRFKYYFRGYIHLKVLPGVSKDNIKQLCSLANRVSLNLEAPRKTYFHELTSTKQFASDLMKRLSWMKKFEPGGGVTTQFVVGAATESDKEIIDTMNNLYKKFNLRRIFFSAFDPVPGTLLQNATPTPSRREFRLYQSDWLLRVYKFDHKDIKSILDANGFLPINKDPKLAWALNNPDLFPIDVNTIPVEELLKVPGIGPRTVDKIFNLRKKGNVFKKFTDLSKIGVQKKAFPFIEVSGKQQLQLSHFS